VARDPDRRKVGGVVSGISRAYGFDVRTTRVAVVVAAVVVPVLVVVYALAWIVLPDRPEAAIPLQDIVRDRRRLPLMIALAVVIVAGGFGSFGSWYLFGGMPWGIGLIALGVLLWMASNLGASQARLAQPPFSVPPPPTRDSVAQPGHATTATGSLIATRRRRTPVGLFSFLAAMTFVGVAAAGDASNWWNISVLAGTVTFLVILAVGATASAIVNRRWLTVPLLVVTAAGASLLLMAQPDLDGGCGERTVRPSSIEQAQTLQRLGLGQLTVDLTALPVSTTTPVSVHTVVGIGRVHVLIPADVVLELDVNLGAGHVVLDGEELADGVRHHEQWTDQPVGTAAGTIKLTVELGIGEVAIDRAAPPG